MFLTAARYGGSYRDSCEQKKRGKSMYGLQFGSVPFKIRPAFVEIENRRLTYLDTFLFFFFLESYISSKHFNLYLFGAAKWERFLFHPYISHRNLVVLFYFYPRLSPSSWRWSKETNIYTWATPFVGESLKLSGRGRGCSLRIRTAYACTCVENQIGRSLPKKKRKKETLSQF